MGNQSFSELLDSLEILAQSAADVMDSVAVARAEIEQLYVKIEQREECT